MAPSQRRRSVDSSSSSSPDPSSPSGTRDQPQLEMPSKLSKDGGGTLRDAQSDQHQHQHEPPPSYTPSSMATTSRTKPAAAAAAPPPQVPPSGYRIPLSIPGPPFPGVERTREAPFTDADGESRVFIGSALMEYSVHPCKVTPDEAHHCRVSYGGGEFQHSGRYDLLPFVPEHMEFVRTSHGRVPYGRRPVKGGFENDGKELYHAVAVIDGVKVPGKAGAHLVRPLDFSVAVVCMGKCWDSCLMSGGR